MLITFVRNWAQTLYDLADLAVNPGPAFFDPDRPNATRYVAARARFAALSPVPQQEQAA